ncbi:hypothetical protein IWQ61_009167 [Dispira simplex]|nr:hypothetical protein IWQ61_009167 [Dispira simplex]
MKFQPNDPGTSTEETTPWTVPRALLNTSSIPFEAHHGPTPMDTWLQQTLNFTLLLPLLTQVQHAHGEHQLLKNRGEAHITVVTPPEFDQILAPVGITAQHLETIAHDYRLQDSPLDVICVGRQIAYDVTTSERMYAYNLLMCPSTWLEIRWAVWRAYVALGGEPSWFSPTLFFPHVTLGYTHRDLHIQDGVFKGVNSCWHTTTTGK